MFNFYKQMRIVPKVVIPVALILVLGLGLLAWQIQWRSAAAVTDVAKRELAALGGENGNLIRAFIDGAVGETRSLGGALALALAEGQEPSRDVLNTMLRGVQRNNPDLFGVGAMWEPNAYDGKDADYRSAPGCDASGRYLPYFATGAEISDQGDQLTSAYYTVPKSTHKTYIAHPQPYTINGKSVPMSTVVYPVMVDGSFRGTVLVDISLARFTQIITDIKAYTTGYAALLNDQGKIMVHHRKDLLDKSVFDIGALRNKTAATTAFKAGQPYFEEVSAPGGVVLRYFHPIPIAGSDQHWYLSITAPESEVMAQATAISRLTLTLCGALLAVLLLAVFLLVRSSLQPVNYLARTAEAIAGGDLQHSINDAAFGGEMKTLSTALKGMIHSLLQTIGKAEALAAEAKEESEKARQATREAEAATAKAENARRDGMLAAAEQLEGVVSVLSSASTELAAQIEQSDRVAAESAQRLTEAATAMNEMNATVQEVAQNASQASEASAETRERALAGARIVEQSLQSIESVRDASLSLKEDMALLNERAQAISRIMAVISDIADQTNLLALNAAIEAARAGEAGRGFAVVADEVRKLAEKTMASTTDVGNAIAAIQNSTTKSMEGVDNAVRQIGQATDFAGQSGKALEEIVSTVEATADQVNAIATASEEQSAASEEINQSISHISSMSHQTAEAMAGAAQAVSGLADQAHRLNKLIEDMERG